jgi:hypothetical protein
LLFGVSGLTAKKSSGRPVKLTKKQKKELVKIIDKEPSETGFMSNCWRSHDCMGGVNGYCCIAPARAFRTGLDHRFGQ